MFSRFYNKFEIFIDMSLMDRLEVNPSQYSFGQYGVCKSMILIEKSFGFPSLHIHTYFLYYCSHALKYCGS